MEKVKLSKTGLHVHMPIIIGLVVFKIIDQVEPVIFEL